jgi:hypothetical protein
MDKNFYRPVMKRIIIWGGIAAGMILLIVLCLAATAMISPGPKDFPAFKKERLRLPVKHESVYLTVAGDAADTSGAKVYSETMYKCLYFMVGDNRYVLNVPAPLPAYRLEKTHRYDIDNDGISEYYSLQDGVLTSYSGTITIWQSPQYWWVDDFFIGDANNDGMSDLNLLIWKAGSFGSRRPFWITRDDTSIKSHLFIFKMFEGSFKPIWQSSNLDRPNYGSVLADINGDGKNELVVSEGNYTIPGERRVSVWQWNGWGFTVIPAET